MNACPHCGANPPPGRPHRHEYPDHYPQATTGRPRSPTGFTPAWGLVRRGPTSDARGLLRD